MENSEYTVDKDGKACEEMLSLGSVSASRDGRLIHCLTVIGEIEGHYVLPEQNKATKYEHIIPLLVAVEESPDIEGLLILLNTAGGDVEAGLAIAELIAGMKTPTVSLVVGGGHSIGVPLSVSAKRSYIVPSASMTIHPVRMNGMMLGVPQSFDYIAKIQDRIINFVTRNSRIPEQKFRELMTNTKELATDVGTVISGAQAVEMGLIDDTGSLSDAISALYDLIETSPPRYPD
jgi:ATP-dependent protease ClpP protease subunit